MANYADLFVPALLAVFLGWGFMLVAPREASRLRQARLAFSLAFFCLFVIAVRIAASLFAGFAVRLVCGTVSGAIIGVLAYAMWLGIANEISDTDRHDQ
jgi:hypothetical protein